MQNAKLFAERAWIFLQKQFVRKVYQPIAIVIREGITPAALSCSVSMGVMSGLFPIVGVTLLVGLLAYFLAKRMLPLNFIVMQAVNAAVTPLELMCIPFFINAGQWLIGYDGPSLAPSALISGLTSNFFETISQFKWILLHSVLGWGVCFPVGTFILFLCLYPIFLRVLPRRKKSPKQVDVPAAMTDANPLSSSYHPSEKETLHHLTPRKQV